MIDFSHCSTDELYKKLTSLTTKYATAIRYNSGAVNQLDEMIQSIKFEITVRIDQKMFEERTKNNLDVFESDPDLDETNKKISKRANPVERRPLSAARANPFTKTTRPTSGES